ncbi:hypothetical protein POTOM_041818 [Populus tomentosa]|uniref:Pentatricopeptide repeat-containing protein n=1 Tax=Populus tomentosa TaxID=118781 RepID=A0A8X7YIC7_POPTO|nr:hypothetical protein POTOM_041818 [Populus tomentosa]
MQERGLVADDFIFSFLLKVCGQLWTVLLGRQMHCSTLNMSLLGTLLFMYMECSRILKHPASCFQIFPALVAWNTMIGSYVSCGKFKEALGMFSRMMELCLEPDEATLVDTFSAGSSLGALDFGRWGHSCISNTDIMGVRIIEVNYSLLDMYAKCGALEEAYETFDGMSKNNTVTWNTMILGLAVMALQMMHWLHGNVELGEQVRKHLLELEQDHMTISLSKLAVKYIAYCYAA